MTRAIQISAGPTNSVVIDRQKMYWMAGKVYLLCVFFFSRCVHEIDFLLSIRVVEDFWRGYVARFPLSGFDGDAHIHAEQ